MSRPTVERASPERARLVGQQAYELPELQPLIRPSSPVPLVSPRVQRVAMLGNHLPRQCGIATFTTDLCEALVAVRPELECTVLAMNDAGHQYDYPARVGFQIPAADLSAYRGAAAYLNVSGSDVVSVQHEYGIFGGDAGAHVLSLLRALRVPVVTTLHTILAAPNPDQRHAMDELTRLSERVVVMTEHGRQLLCEVHGVSETKIDVIPHGVADELTGGRGKAQLGVRGRPVILTFGLLTPDKGLEYVIDALPAILERHPHVVYIVLGATHPQVRAQHGEAYRQQLRLRAEQLGVDASLIMHDRFVSKVELAEFMGAADLYITPYLNPEQISSGTLAYAVGAGKAVLSTPYAYARELLAEGRGVLVPWRDPAAIAREVCALLDDEVECDELRARAAAYGQRMRWPAVALAYFDTFEKAHASYARRPRALTRTAARSDRPLELPAVNLQHLRTMTDDTGLLQHALYTVPRYQDGYCLDDNARALILTTQLEAGGTDQLSTVRALGARYLAFVSHAYDGRDAHFRNFMSYGRQWRDERGSEDGHGRALWALGHVVAHARDPGRRRLAHELFQAALPRVRQFSSPRAWAYALLGVAEYVTATRESPGVESCARELAERLLALYLRNCQPGWLWFEEHATYANARLPQALLASSRWMGRDALAAAGLTSLEWLTQAQRSPEGCFAPVGTSGFLSRGVPKAAFDQQPLEAGGMVSACLLAHQITGDQRWLTEARRAFGWFLGQNQLGVPLYDSVSGGCRDGLHADRANENQGAESTLSFLSALVELRALVARAPAQLRNITPAQLAAVYA